VFYILLTAKIVRVMGMVENIRVSKVAWRQNTWSQLFLPILGMVVLLTIASSFDGSENASYHVIAEGAPTVTLRNYECSRYNLTVYYAITAYVGATVVWGVWITSKAFGVLALANSLWSNSSKTWEIRLISYAIYFMSAALGTVIILSPYQQHPWYLHELRAVMVMLSGTTGAMCIKYLPKMFLIYNEKLLQASSSGPQSGNSPKNTSAPKGNAGLAGSTRDSASANPKLVSAPSVHSFRQQLSPADVEMPSMMPWSSGLHLFGLDGTSTRAPSTPRVEVSPDELTNKESFGYVATLHPCGVEGVPGRYGINRQGAAGIHYEVAELARLLSTRGKEKDEFLDHCIREHSIENVSFLNAFVDAQHYWQVRVP
jgi:hypothetical protein